MKKENFDKLMTKAKALINLWSLRSLTVIGKILIVNTLLVSQFVNKMLCMNSPGEDYFKEFRKMVRDFIWYGKKSKVAYKELVQNYQHGGLKLVY